MKVLYLSPLIPDVSGSGGKRAVYNHLAALMDRPNLSLQVVAIDEEATGEVWPTSLAAISAKVFPRGLPRLRSGWRGITAAVAQLLISPLPRSAAVIKSRPAREYIKSLLDQERYDVVVVDLMKAYALLEGHTARIPIVYISHNVEADIHFDRWRAGSFLSASTWMAAMEFMKTRHYEGCLVKEATRVINISSGDMHARMFQKWLDKLCCWPELPVPRNQQWEYRKTKNLLFVGSAGYFPNKEAIEWLVNGLMPRVHSLDPSIQLKIVGTKKEDVSAVDCKNVEFCGFVSYDRLVALHYGSDLFISPVVLGSGIKIKVLEASAYGMPIAASKESLRGVDYLSEVVCTISRDVEEAARSIVQLLNDSQGLLKMHDQIFVALQRAIGERDSLEGLLQSAVREAYSN